MDNGSVRHFDDWRAKLGREVRDCRKRLGWDQVTLAAKASHFMYPNKERQISTETISRVENGGNTTTEILNALALALDVEVRVRLRPIGSPDSTKPESPVQKPEAPAGNSPKPTPTEQVHGLLRDLTPPPGDGVNVEMDASSPSSRLARIGADLLEVIEDLEARGQAPVARGSGPDRPARHRPDRRRPDRQHPQKTSSKRR